MARAKWIFGAQQSPATQLVTKPVVPPVSSSADAKKFGLENFGNTCYANSVIQALYFCTPFRDLMLQSSDHSVPQVPQDLPPPPSTPTKPSPPRPLAPVRRKPERKPSTSGQSIETPTITVVPLPVVPPIPSAPPTLFSALRSLFQYISTHPAEKGTVAPRAFIDKLKEVNELFRSTMHQDAHEFLNYLLNKIVEEVEEERRLVQNATGDDLSNSIATMSSTAPPTIVTATTSSNSGTLPQDATLVHKLFEGVLTSETRCLTCETVSSRDESFLDLSIDIEQNSSVTACLRQFSASEMLCQKNKFFCDSCCDLQEAEKRMKIKKLPNVLALHLKRFKYQEDVQKYIKLAYRVAFPFELRLFNTVDDTDDADRLYNLFGIVVHIGNGPHHGHYVSIIKTLGTWLVFDDDNVYPIPEGDIHKYFGDSNSGSAYVLYYQAADIDLPGLGLRTAPLGDVPVPGLSSPPVNDESSSDQSTNINTTPALPPGLVEEGDWSDLSDPPFPITPSSTSSPLHTFSDHHREKPSHSRQKTPPGPLEIKPTDLGLGDSHTHISHHSNHSGGTLPSPATASTPTNGGRIMGNLFSTIRRTPSVSTKPGSAGGITSTGPDSRRSLVERSHRPATSPLESAVSEDGHFGKNGVGYGLKVIGELPPLPASPAVAEFISNGNERDKESGNGRDNGKEKEKRKEPERKSSMWFGKRKSFRVGDKTRPGSAMTEVPPSPTVPSRTDDTGTATSASSSAAWFRHSTHQPKDKKSRRPSDGGLFEPPSAMQTSLSSSSSAASHPLNFKSNAGGLALPDTDQHRRNGYESPSPGSATSSVGSSSHLPTMPIVAESPAQTQQHPTPPSPQIPELPPPRSLPPIPVPIPAPPDKQRALQPDRKKTLPSVPGLEKERVRGPPLVDLPLRPATAGAPIRTSTVGAMPFNGGKDRDTPPLPLPPMGFLVGSHERHRSNGQAFVADPESISDRGKTRTSEGGGGGNAGGEHGGRLSTGALGLSSFVGANESTTSTTTSHSASSNLRRATRKLSLTAPMLGFGRRDKDKKEKEKDKVAPSSFPRF